MFCVCDNDDVVGGVGDCVRVAGVTVRCCRVYYCYPSTGGRHKGDIKIIEQTLNIIYS